MFRWLRAFIRREVIDDVPPEMDLCLDCGKVDCSECEFEHCEARLRRAAQLRGEACVAEPRTTPASPKDGAGPA